MIEEFHRKCPLYNEKGGFDSELIETMESVFEFKDFFWMLSKPEQIPNSFWKGLSEKAEHLGFKGYKSLAEFYLTGEIKSFSEPKTTEEKLKELKEPHWKHISPEDKYEKILEKGLLSFEYLTQMGNAEHGHWGRVRDPKFIYFNPHSKVQSELLEGMCRGESTSSDLAYCVSPELNEEMHTSHDETIYPGTISPYDIISINIGDKIRSEETKRDKEIFKENMELAHKIYKLQEKYFEKEYKIPIIVNTKEIVY